MENDKTLKKLTEAWKGMEAKKARLKEIQKRIKLLGQQISVLHAEREALTKEMYDIQGVVLPPPRDLYAVNPETGEGGFQQGRDGH